MCFEATQIDRSRAIESKKHHFFAEYNGSRVLQPIIFQSFVLMNNLYIFVQALLEAQVVELHASLARITVLSRCRRCRWLTNHRSLAGTVVRDSPSLPSPKPSQTCGCP